MAVGMYYVMLSYPNAQRNLSLRYRHDWDQQKSFIIERLSSGQGLTLGTKKKQFCLLPAM